MTTRIVCALAALVVLTTRAPQAQSPANLFIDAAEPANPPAAGPEVVRRRWITVNWPVLTAALPLVNGGSGATDTITLNLFADTSIVVVRDRVDTLNTGYVWVGHVQGASTDVVTLSVVDSAMAGTIRSGGAAYAIRPVADGTHVVDELSFTSLPSEGEPLVPPAGEAQSFAEPTTLDDGSRIDVLLLFTPQARAQVGGTAGMHAFANDAITVSNEVMSNSGVIPRFHLAHVAEIAGVTENGDFYSMLVQVKENQTARALRDTHAADLVHLVVASAASSTRGIAWVMPTASLDFASNAYSVSLYSWTTNQYTMAHEMGHNMGLAHDQYVIPSGGYQGVFPYGRGWVNPAAFAPGAPTNKRWRVVMSYAHQCYNFFGSDCTTERYFSNPNILHPVSGDPMGHPDTADAARVLNEVRHIVANFRPSMGYPPPAGPFSKLNPPSGITGVGSTATLSWGESANATQYEYCLSSCSPWSGWTATGTERSVTVTLAPGTHYRWGVRAWNGPYSNSITYANAPGPVPTWDLFTQGSAQYSTALTVPMCNLLAAICDARALVWGIGNHAWDGESNPSNTILSSCTDGSGDESFDVGYITNLRVETLNGQPLAPGQQVRLSVATWGGFVPGETVDVFFTGNALVPSWTYLTNVILPPGAGEPVLTATYTLPPGELQAVRARFSRGMSSTNPCPSPNGDFTDVDDLVFRVGYPPFTHDPVSQAEHVVLSMHVTEIRSRIDEARSAAALAPFSWDSTFGTGMIRANHVLQLRTALDAVYVARSVTPPTYTDPGLPAPTVIKAVHINELRQAVRGIE